MSKQAVSFDAVGELIKKLDRIAGDGSSYGTLRLRMDFTKLTDGEIGLVGKAELPEQLAAIAKLFPAGIEVEREKFQQWAGSYDFDLNWTFGPKGADLE